MSVLTKATIEDLYAVEGKAEIINGEIVNFMATGFQPNRAAGRIYRSLGNYEDVHGGGFALSDNAGFHVDLPHRESFSPDAAWYTGPNTGTKFPEGTPAFAVEVRSEHDYGRAAEREIEAKRYDYFDAGTLVVWDVDILSNDVVKCYRWDAPDEPRIFRRGDIADAEPAVPGWRLAVDTLFR
jgi:Uma2 family endonuclease